MNNVEKIREGNRHIASRVICNIEDNIPEAKVAIKNLFPLFILHTSQVFSSIHEESLK